MSKMSTPSTPLITSTQNQKVKGLIALKEKRVRDEKKVFLIENEHLIQEAIIKNRLQELWVCQDYQGAVDYPKKVVISRAVADKLSITKSKASLFGVCRIVDSSLEGTHFLICDGVQDPGNLGTLIRSAVSFGFDGVIVSENSADFYNDKCVRSSQGALFYCNLIRMNLKMCIKQLKEKNIPIVGTDVNQATALSDVTLTNCAVVVGNEGAGVSTEVKACCDYLVKIETSTFESLNVAVAGSILMYTFRK